MNGRNLLFRALRGEKTERPPWVPFVGVHGGYLINETATNFLQSADKLVEGQKKAIELYQPDGIPVAFDLQLEAEVLGCELHWADDVPPSVCSHVLQNCSDTDQLPAYDTSKGRFPVIAEASDRLARDFGNEVVFYGLICGPFTLLSHLRGSEVFLDMMMDPEPVKAAMAYCAEVAKKTADFYLDHGCEVIAVVDPMTSQVSEEHFEEFVAPYVNAVFDHVNAKEAFSSLFVCGDATRNLEAMCQTTCDNISIDENIPLELLKELAQKHEKSFGGNLKLTSALLLGAPDDCKLDAIACIDNGGDQGFILAPGCDLPYAVPPENLMAVTAMVHDEYQREIARTSAKATEMVFEDIQKPDYERQEGVVIDCITLDSTSCAPCQYMVAAATQAAQRANARVEVNEHKIKQREGIGMMCLLNVKNIPALCIDGEPKFVSIIPDQDTLVKAIESRYLEKSGAKA